MAASVVELYGAMTIFPSIIPPPFPPLLQPPSPVIIISPLKLNSPFVLNVPVTTKIPPPDFKPCVGVQSPSQNVRPAPVVLLPMLSRVRDGVKYRFVFIADCLSRPTKLLSDYGVAIQSGTSVTTAGGGVILLLLLGRLF